MILGGTLRFSQPTEGGTAVTLRIPTRGPRSGDYPDRRESNSDETHRTRKVVGVRTAPRAYNASRFGSRIAEDV